MNRTSQAESSRLILCDPVCVLPYGHNVAAMENFRTFVGQYFDSTLCFASRFLSEDIAAARGISREFNYCYTDAIPLPEGAEAVDAPTKHSEKLQVAKSDLLAMLDRHQVSGSDVICYPSIDFYALHALADAVDELKAAGGPMLMIRLIGVMETAASGKFSKPMNVVLALLSRLILAGLRLRLAAETPRYADFLATHLDHHVTVAPNVETRELVPLSTKGHFTVICPGSARYDKGFLDLLEIFSRVRRQDPDLKIRFVTQLLPDRDLKHQLAYVQKLYAVPGLTVKPSQISSEEIAQMYHDADLVLLPYDRAVYEFRGSAALIEAMCTGRYALALEGPAFVDQMRFFGAGSVCSGIADMADKVLEFSKRSPAVRFAQARQARHRFLRDLADSYREWVGR